jgi:hypothetical protein
VISVVLVSLAQETVEETTSHIPNEIGLASITALVSAHMRYYLIPQYLLGKLNLSFLMVRHPSQFFSVSADQDQTIMCFIKRNLFN